METLYTRYGKMDGGKEVVNVNQPKIAPLKRQHIKLFYPKRTIGFFSEDNKSFVGILSRIEYVTIEDETIASLTVTFLWAVEIEGTFVASVKGGKVFRKEDRKKKTLLLPQNKPLRKDGMLACCSGEHNDQKLTLSRRIVHVEIVKQVGKEYGIKIPV